MKKLFSTVCITFSLLFSSAATTAVRADDGDGHAPGYVCETTGCPPNDAPSPQQQQQSGTSVSNNQATEDTSLTLLKLIITLLPKSKKSVNSPSGKI